MRCANKLLLATAACAAVGCLCAMPARADVLLSYEKIYLEGETAPGLETIPFSSFDAPVISSTGQIAFYALFEDGTTHAGLWANSSGNFELGVRTGANAPGTTDNLFNLVGTVNNRVGIGGDGNIIFHGAMDTTPDRGIWHGTPGALSLIAREGQATPAGGTYESNLGRFSIGVDGSPAFASVVTSGSEQSMFLGDGPAGSLQTLYLAGSQVPGESGGVLYQGSAGAIPPQVNTAGEAAFLGALKGGATGAALFLGTAGDARVVAAVGRAAPGMGLSVDFESLQRPDLDENGNVVFTAGLTNFGGTGTADAVFYGGLGSISPAAKVGDVVGGNPDFTYASFSTAFGPTTNDLGAIAFLATLADFPGQVNDDSNAVIMAGQAGDPNDLFVIGREGSELAVGFSLIAGPLINNQGLIAFGTNSTVGPNPAGDELWLADLATSELVRVIGTGDDGSIVGVPSTLVTGLSLAGTTDGFRFLSDEGTLTFRLTFDDGSEGVFKVTLIPEPAAAALLGLGVLALLARRRRV